MALDLAGGVEFDAVGDGVDPADPVPGNAHLNDLRLNSPRAARQ
ncbi:MAG TPA: hypothetical protein VES60_06285 [Nakamurella sp.]|nr:hypothetical protein [Nakamurella sp.]